jgi:hypothetical protein
LSSKLDVIVNEYKSAFSKNALFVELVTIGLKKLTAAKMKAEKQPAIANPTHKTSPTSNEN